MKVICVDDEALILQLTVSMCEELDQVDEVQGFTRAAEAIKWLETNKTDICILDIDMPEMDGITLAAKIKERQPDAAIIFLTGYAQYAVEAFAMHASGYLLKPASPERLAAEIDYAMAPRKAREKGPIQVKTFGNFDILVNGKPLTFDRSKAKELLAYLIDRQGRNVTRAEAFSVIWESGTYDRSMQKQLDVVIRSLRSTLSEYGIEGILEMHRGGMRVRTEDLDCDLYHFLGGEVDVINEYRGEYMSAYSWASLTEGFIDRKKEELLNK